MTNTLAAPKQLLGKYAAGSQHWVGDGFPVRNLFPSNGLRYPSPFLMLDYAGPATFPPSPDGRPRGVEEHPHRGFETVSIAYQGSVSHRDSAGNSGTIGEGDVQWMTAASGVVHEEMHSPEFTAKGGTFEFVQLWVNLPAAHKMSPPRYQAITKQQIPVVPFPGNAAGQPAYARIIAGQLQTAQGPAQTFTPINLWDLFAPAGSTLTLPVPEGQSAMLVLLRGAITLPDSQEKLQGEAKLAQFSQQGGAITFTATEDSKLLLLAGEPIEEPMASYGPFVMNTQEELRQAVYDYQAGRMGSLA